MPATQVILDLSTARLQLNREGGFRRRKTRSRKRVAGVGARHERNPGVSFASLSPTPATHFKCNITRSYWSAQSSQAQPDLLQLRCSHSKLRSRKRVAGVGARYERNPGVSFAGSVQPRPQIFSNGTSHEATGQRKTVRHSLTFGNSTGKAWFVENHRTTLSSTVTSAVRRRGWCR